MKEKWSSMTGAMFAVVGAAPTWTTAGILALLGLAGSTSSAMVAAQWLGPVMIGLSILLLGRAFYILYVQHRGNRASRIITWMSAAFMAGFWTWRLLE